MGKFRVEHKGRLTLLLLACALTASYVLVAWVPRPTPAMTYYQKANSLLVPTASLNSSTKYYAILIGISDYPGTSNDLQYCHRDAMDMRDLLISNFFFQASNIQLLINSSAMKFNIKTAIESMINVTTDNDVIFFSYSGHGYRDTQHSYLVPFDGLLGPKINGSELATWFNELRFKQMYVIIDACYSGGILDALSNPKIYGMMACENNELSYESDSLHNGVFTRYFINAFSRGANQRYLHDANGDSCIDLAKEAFPHVNASTHVYYQPLNASVNARQSNWSAPLSLDWSMEAGPVHYTSTNCYLEINFELSRTQDFRLFMTYYPVSYLDPEPASPPTFTYQINVSNTTAPLLLSLAFINGSQDYGIVINQTIQNHSIFYQYNPFKNDLDGDGISDGIEWDMRPLYDPENSSDAIIDHDGDGLSSIEEFYTFHTNPLKWDTDGDSFADGVEVQFSTNAMIGWDSPLTRAIYLVTFACILGNCFNRLYKHKKKQHPTKSNTTSTSSTPA
jgi:hypothetical protein